MEFKSFKSFIRGVFENEGKESSIADNFLVKCHNVDIDITGKLVSRYGHKSRRDFDESASTFELPVNKSFGNKIQSIFQYIDVAGVKYIMIVCNGKVYVEILDKNDNKQGQDGKKKPWDCCRPHKN